MNTPRDLMKSTWERYKNIVLLKADLEDYVLFGLAKTLSFAAGIAIGYYWL